MEVRIAYLLIQVVADHFGEYPADVRRQLMEGVYETVMAAGETMAERADLSAEPPARQEIKIALSLIESALLEGNFTEAPVYVLDCLNNVLPPRN